MKHVPLYIERRDNVTRELWMINKDDAGKWTFLEKACRYFF